MTLAVNVAAIVYWCVTVGTVVTTAGDPSPKLHVYVHPLVGGTRVTVKTAVAAEPLPAHPSIATVKVPIFGHGAGGWQRNGTDVVASHCPSEHVAVTLIGLSQAHLTLEPNVACQFPAESTGTDTDVGPVPQSMVTLTSPVSQPVAVPETMIDVGNVDPGGRMPTMLPIVMVQAMSARNYGVDLTNRRSPTNMQFTPATGQVRPAIRVLSSGDDRVDHAARKKLARHDGKPSPADHNSDPDSHDR